MKKFLLTLFLLLLFSTDVKARGELTSCSYGFRYVPSYAALGSGKPYCDYVEGASLPTCPPDGDTAQYYSIMKGVCERCDYLSYDCHIGWYFKDSEHVVSTPCDRVYDNCLSCDLKKCYSCWYGYGLDEDGKCYKLPDCPSNCSSCSDSSTCTSCDDGYTLSNGECVKKPTCSNGQYTASDGTCQPCSNISVPNGSCLSCSSSSQCDNISCNTGYVKKGGTCVKAATCTYPLKEVTDYSGECAGCCTD